MKTKLGFQYFLIPAVYLLLVAGFIHLQSAGSRQSFGFQAGPAAVSGNRSGGRVSAVLKLYGRSIVLHEELADENGVPLSLEDVTGDQQKIRLQYRGGVSIELSAAGMELDILPESGTGGVQLRPSSPPWQLTPVAHLPAVILEQGGGRSMLELKRAAVSADGTLTLNGDGARIGFLPAPDGDPVRFWFFRDGAPAAGSLYESTMRDYLELAYSGWKSGRYNAGSDTWDLPGGSPQFLEPALVGMVAEGFRRRDMVDLAAVKGMSTRHEDKITELSAPYVGLLVLTDEERREKIAAVAERIRARAAENDPALFAEADRLVEFLLYYGDRRLTADVASFISRQAFVEREMSARQLAGLVEVYVDAGNLYPERFPGYEKLYALIDSVLLPRIARADGELYLFDGDDSVDLAASLKAGYYLQEIGRGENRELLEEIGRTMVVSALSLADVSGYLPARLFPFRPEEGSRSEGHILPESVYPLLAENLYYPRHAFLYKELGSEVSLWTVAQSVSASRGSDAYTISFSFPAGATHHMVIRNVPPFAYLELYGIRWNGTRQFQYYDAGGWYYDRESRTLYLKVRHKRSREEVVIHFSEPAGSAAAPAPAATGTSGTAETAGVGGAASGTGQAAAQ